ncbi:ABC transporter permease [Streptomyces griseocarneus]|uniref:ABC transporter permease n=1 Tax=Streptomyces griseocarneus TaxID=51201 RepID=UPI00167DE363|nr:ABC transporter permease [Streptomyces griseocarneus]MBZ6474661.1 ABC transporter permease [Streptomyces griseocarneus]GHG66982.1 ABC transporter permease [Streptomyces griseocarneus]
MTGYVLRRALQAAAVLLAITAAAFGLFYAAPADPALIACGPKCDTGQVEAVRHSMGLDQPLAGQYTDYLRGLVAGRVIGDVDGTPIDCPAPCLGYSYTLHQPVLDAIGDRFPVTLSLAAGALAVILVLGVGTGFAAALRRGTRTDRLLSGFTLIGASVQIYFLGYALQYLLVYSTGLFPVPQYAPFGADPGAWATGLLLPWLVLGFVNAAVFARLARSQMLETMHEGYVRTARGKGMSALRAHLKYTARGAAAPLAQLLGLEAGALFGGAFITETVFGLGGIGKLAVDAVVQNDLPTVVGTVLLAAFFVVLFVALADLVVALLDPRVRLA